MSVWTRDPTLDRTGQVHELARPDLPWGNGYTVLVVGFLEQNLVWECLVLHGDANNPDEAGEIALFRDESLARHFKRIA